MGQFTVALSEVRNGKTNLLKSLSPKVHSQTMCESFLIRKNKTNSQNLPINVALIDC